MSKYTTQVRFICESKSGLANSAGSGKVNEVIQKSWNKIFTSDVAFFDESYRSVLCSKILKHYYLREIGTETVGVWELWMNTRLEEIMPYYNELYKSALIEFNPMHNTYLETTHKRDTKHTETAHDRLTRTIRGDDNTEYNMLSEHSERSEDVGGRHAENGQKDLYSDTPQGSISNLENESYLTNARRTHEKIDDNYDQNTNSSGNNHEHYTNTRQFADYTESDNNRNSGVDGLENFIEKVSGNSGSSFSGLLLEFRKTLLNIDMLVIDEFDDLFMGLW